MIASVEPGRRDATHGSPHAIASSSATGKPFALRRQDEEIGRAEVRRHVVGDADKLQAIAPRRPAWPPPPSPARIASSTSKYDERVAPTNIRTLSTGEPPPGIEQHARLLVGREEADKHDHRPIHRAVRARRASARRSSRGCRREPIDVDAVGHEQDPLDRHAGGEVRVDQAGADAQVEVGGQKGPQRQAALPLDRGRLVEARRMQAHDDRLAKHLGDRRHEHVLGRVAVQVHDVGAADEIEEIDRHPPERAQLRNLAPNIDADAGHLDAVDGVVPGQATDRPTWSGPAPRRARAAAAQCDGTARRRC